MNKIYIAAALIALSLFGVSCSTSQGSLTYFENVDSIATGGIGNNDYCLKVVPDDELKIVITSQEPSVTAPYNLPMANYAATSELSAAASPALQTYLVDREGYIELPILGRIHVAGKTTDKIEEEIKTLVGKDVKDPFVSVAFHGYKVNVLGEVKKPGAKLVTKERYSILDAIADAEDLTEYGKRENILLIREENGKKVHVRLNLNDVKMMESPYFYLQQNDIVYVEPNKIKVGNSKYNQDNGFKLSVISTIVSACSVVASLIIALVAK